MKIKSENQKVKIKNQKLKSKVKIKKLKSKNQSENQKLQKHEKFENVILSLKLNRNSFGEFSNIGFT